MGHTSLRHCLICGTRRADVGSTSTVSSNSVVVALHPAPQVLEGVVRGGPWVLAVRAHAQLVAKAEPVSHPADTNVIHAACHVEVLAPLGQHAPHVGHACLSLVEVCLHRLVGEDLHGTVHHREVRGVGELVAIDDKDILARVRGHVLAHARGHDHGVRIHLDRPGVVPESTILHDRPPHVYEELCVARRAVLRRGDLGRLDMHRRDTWRKRDAALIGAEDGSFIAGEDANLLVILSLDDAHLVASSPGQGEAEEGRPANRGLAPAARGQRLARPGLVPGVDLARLAPAAACGVVFILLIALHVDAKAALRVLAVLVIVGARAGLQGPLLKLASLHGRCRCARADLVAAPSLFPRLPRVHARVALLLAEAPKDFRACVGLGIALHAGL
mmetsp:Transcript_77979/g.200767  ORF Transcript_77979/g.200767 Transcript_77979/m.200767 type:complete len:388 (-) Transcript_77979:1915-3078(-)